VIPFSLNINGRLIDVTRPQIMGIVNITPDSFFSGSRTTAIHDIEARVTQILAEGADMIDVGAYSSRPGADDVPIKEEMSRLRTGMKVIRSIAPDIPVSVDTFRADVATFCITELGADIINDISGGLLDNDMIPSVARLKVPYILMHMRGTPETMQQYCNYNDVTSDVINELSAQINLTQEYGIADVIIDPGFGFSKNLKQNYKLLADLHLIEETFGRPVLAGVSRKSMITRPLEISPDRALNGTTVIHTIALMNGASILRVHDVAEARQAVILTSLAQQQ